MAKWPSCRTLPGGLAAKAMEQQSSIEEQAVSGHWPLLESIKSNVLVNMLCTGLEGASASVLNHFGSFVML